MYDAEIWVCLHEIVWDLPTNLHFNSNCSYFCSVFYLAPNDDMKSKEIDLKVIR